MNPGILSAVVRGNVDHDNAIARLDTLRWLRRISFHLWRITRHLRHARFDDEFAAEEQNQTPTVEAQQPAQSS